METTIKVLIAIIAGIHFLIFCMEMFAWEKMGKNIYVIKKETLPDKFFEQSKPLAANQGLSNGFLAAGLIWTFFIEDKLWQANIAVFFLYFIVLAGIYGGYSVKKTIFFIQAIPAIITLGLMLIIK